MGDVNITRLVSVYAVAEDGSESDDGHLENNDDKTNTIAMTVINSLLMLY